MKILSIPTKKIKDIKIKAKLTGDALISMSQGKKSSVIIKSAP
jgi:hypothetical protein